MLFLILPLVFLWVLAWLFTLLTCLLFCPVSVLFLFTIICCSTTWPSFLLWFPVTLNWKASSESDFIVMITSPVVSGTKWRQTRHTWNYTCLMLMQCGHYTLVHFSFCNEQTAVVNCRIWNLSYHVMYYTMTLANKDINNDDKYVILWLPLKSMLYSVLQYSLRISIREIYNPMTMGSKNYFRLVSGWGRLSQRYFCSDINPCA